MGEIEGMAKKIKDATDPVAEICNWESHCSAYYTQQKILSILEVYGVKTVRQFIRFQRRNIDAVFFQGKSDKLLEILSEG